MRHISNMSGKIRELKLPVYLEDISSTRIRENIDLGRDISRPDRSGGAELYI